MLLDEVDEGLIEEMIADGSLADLAIVNASKLPTQALVKASPRSHQIHIQQVIAGRSSSLIGHTPPVLL
jgi:hypothetical protein